MVSLLINSPLVSPGSWRLVAEELSRHNVVAVTPDLDGDESIGQPLWQQHAQAAAEAFRGLPPHERPVLVGHSGAGSLLPAIRQAASRPVAGYLFVDAGLPDGNHARMAIGEGDFAEQLQQIYAAGRRYPDWTEEMLRDVVPEPERRRQLISELRPQPFRFWQETVPVFEGWPDAPCGYLRFLTNPAYEGPASEAVARGWPLREIAGDHFHMLVDPAAVARAIVSP